MLPVCAWVFSRLSNRSNVFELKSLQRRMVPSTRRHLAKALRRLQAWPLLIELAAENPSDARIQWFAHAGLSQLSFAKRLERFAANVDDSQAGEVRTPSQMPFWAADRRWYRSPPKSAAIFAACYGILSGWCGGRGLSGRRERFSDGRGLAGGSSRRQREAL